ncbi:MAG: hypothetical protein ACE5EL_01140 [Anaerolineae bacterium]
MTDDAFILDTSGRRQRAEQRERARRQLRRAEARQASTMAGVIPGARWDLALGATAGVAGAAAVAVAGQLLLEALRALV